MLDTAGVKTDKTRSALALMGGAPAVTEPLPPMYPGAMRIGPEEEEAVLDVLRSKRLFRRYGPYPGPSRVEALEGAFAARVRTPYSVAVTSGTAALVCALQGCGLGPGDEVIVPAYTWIAPALAALAVGAVPIIAEVDASLTFDPADVENKITNTTKAIVAVHMRGASCNMGELTRIAQQHNLRLLEDVAQATGGSYQGRPLGSIGDAGAFSFQFNKIVTSGEGGMVTTSDPVVYQRAFMYHDMGSSLDRVPPDHILPGLNFRMPELLGAVALVQLGRLDGLLEAMRQRKALLKARMATVAEQTGVTFRALNDEQGDAAIALVFYLPTAERAADTARALRAEGAGAYTLYDPARGPDYHIYRYWLPILDKRVWSARGGPWRWHSREVTYAEDMCPRTLDLLARAVHLDISPELTERAVDQLAIAINKVLTTL